MVLLGAAIARRSADDRIEHVHRPDTDTHRLLGIGRLRSVLSLSALCGHLSGVGLTALVLVSQLTRTLAVRLRHTGDELTLLRDSRGISVATINLTVRCLPDSSVQRFQLHSSSRERPKHADASR